MKRFLIVFALIVIGVGVLGFYRGWFHVTSGSEQGQAHFDLTVDKDKIHQDADKTEKKVQDLGSQVREKVVPTGARGTGPAPPSGPSPRDRQ